MKGYSSLFLFLLFVTYPSLAQDTLNPYSNVDSAFVGSRFEKTNPETLTEMDEFVRKMSESNRKDHQCIVAFKNVSIVDAKNNTIKKHRTVIQQDGIIIKIGFSLFTSHKGAEVINCNGKYLAPGLTDMHVHFMCTNRDRIQYILYGVTSIRNMSGSPYHLADKDFIYSKEILSPRLYTSGPPLTSGNGTFMSQIVNDTSSARNAVRAQYKEGYDFIKTDKRLNDTCLYVVLDEALKLGMRVAAELPDNVDLSKLAEYKSILTIEGFSGKLKDKKQLASMATAGIPHCPNFVSTAAVIQTKTRKAFVEKPEALIASDKQRALLETNLTEFINYVRPEYRSKVSFYKSYFKNGGELLLGSESGLIIPMLIPGASLHDELKSMQLLGLKNNEIILAATENAANVLRRSPDELQLLNGTISEGAISDMVLLSANPLEHIENYKSITGVMINGTWLPSKSLAGIRKGLEKIR
ncbi:MAG TPA: hypothetical protein VGC65_04490 [Bacteroidia bacterium]|jgi:hypothetical protein